MNCISLILFVVIVLIVLSMGSNGKYTIGGNPCPPGTYQARCIGPNGEPICVALSKNLA